MGIVLSIHEQLSAYFFGQSLPEGVVLQLRTRPVNAEDVDDGDGVRVYLDHSHALSERISEESLQAVSRNSRKTFRKLLREASNPQNVGYRYCIRLRGIDAPEMGMEYGREAKNELVSLVDGKCLLLQVYNIDRFGRLVADVYCSDGIFLQKEMLRRGFAWHYERFDGRRAFADWQEEANSGGVGLWASPNPQRPWEWRDGGMNG